jgi:hypothetical protein
MKRVTILAAFVLALLVSGRVFHVSHGGGDDLFAAVSHGGGDDLFAAVSHGGGDDLFV